jgi:predicted nucleotidyltransferase
LRLHGFFMNERSLPKFVASNNSVDRLTVEVIRVVHQAAAELGLKYFLAGATAREIMLRGVFGLSPGRATLDIDFGFAVESWAEFEKLKSALIKTGKFKASDKVQQRLYYFVSEHQRMIVDLIPFGSIEEPKGSITWPPDKDTIMNVIGFGDALSSAVTVKIADDLSVFVASIVGMTILKLLAWTDRRSETNKDASDLLKILKDYAIAGNEERLYVDEVALLEEVEFDLDVAGARLLGADTARLATAEAAEKIRLLLDSEPDVEDLIAQGFSSGDDYQFAALLSNFRIGFLGQH